MTRCKNPARRQALEGAGILAATTLAALLWPDVAVAHEGHDHAPRTILDLKGKLVWIVGPSDVVSDEFVQGRVTIRVDDQGRIVDLRYG